jgi:hypothetical protein
MSPAYLGFSPKSAFEGKGCWTQAVSVIAAGVNPQIEMLMEVFIRKQVGLKAHKVTRVEETAGHLIVHIDR